MPRTYAPDVAAYEPVRDIPLRFNCAYCDQKRPMMHHIFCRACYIHCGGFAR